MEVGDGSRTHFMMTRSLPKKDECDVLEQSGTSTPELPTKVQKVSTNFSHGCEISVPLGTSPTKQLDDPSSSSIGPLDWPLSVSDCVVTLMSEMPRGSTVADAISMPLISDSPSANNSSIVTENNCIATTDSVIELIPLSEANGIAAKASTEEQNFNNAAESLEDSNTSGIFGGCSYDNNDQTETVLLGSTEKNNNALSNGQQTNETKPTSNEMSGKGNDRSGIHQDAPPESDNILMCETKQEVYIDLEPSLVPTSDSAEQVLETTDARESQPCTKPDVVSTLSASEVTVVGTTSFTASDTSLDVSQQTKRLDTNDSQERIVTKSEELKSDIGLSRDKLSTETGEISEGSDDVGRTADLTSRGCTKLADDGVHSVIAALNDCGDSVESNTNPFTISDVPSLPQKSLFTQIVRDCCQKSIFIDCVVIFDNNFETKKWQNQRPGTCNLLLNQKTGSVRIRIQRENEVILEHLLTSSLKFKPLVKCDRAYSWCAVDVSNLSNIRPQCYAVRFQSIENALSFKKSVDTVQTKMINDRIPFFELRDFPTFSPTSNAKRRPNKHESADGDESSTIFDPVAKSMADSDNDDDDLSHIGLQSNSIQEKDENTKELVVNDVLPCGPNKTLNVSNSSSDVDAKPPYFSCWKKSFESIACTKGTEPRKAESSEACKPLDPDNKQRPYAFSFDPVRSTLGVHQFDAPVVNPFNLGTTTNKSSTYVDNVTVESLLNCQNAASTTLSKSFKFSFSASTDMEYKFGLETLEKVDSQTPLAFINGGKIFGTGTPKTSKGIKETDSETPPGGIESKNLGTGPAKTNPGSSWSFSPNSGLPGSGFGVAQFSQTSNFGVAKSGPFFSTQFGASESADTASKPSICSERSIGGEKSPDNDENAAATGLPMSRVDPGSCASLDPVTNTVGTVSSRPTWTSLSLGDSCNSPSAGSRNGIFYFSESLDASGVDDRVEGFPSGGASTSGASPFPVGGDANTSFTGFNFSLGSRKELPKPIKNHPKGWKARSRVQRGPPPVSDIEASMLRSLECPVCLDPCTPPIYTCLKGHHVCSACRPRIKACGVCKAPISTARNWLAEDISAKIVKVACKNADTGCSKLLYLKDMPKHVQVCSHSIRCPCVAGDGGPCTWRGAAGDLDAHAGESHEVSASTEHPLPLHTTARTLVRAHGHLFHCVMEYCRAVGGWIPHCRILGPPRDAPDFRCKFALSARPGPFTLTYVDRVLELTEDLGEASPLVVNVRLIEGLVRRGQTVFFRVDVLADEPGWCDADRRSSSASTCSPMNRAGATRTDGLLPRRRARR